MSVRRALPLSLCALVCALVLTAGAQARERPIVYVVVLDGLEGEWVERGSAPFISSLLATEGTYFPQSSSVIPAETNPNHTAMMSGAYPNRSGIAANAFALYAPLAGEDGCLATGPIDESAMPTETSGESADCPTAQMVFEAIREQGNPDELVTAGVFGKPKLGRIFAGRNFDPGRRDLDYLWAPCASGADDDDYCGSVPTNPVSGYAVDDRTVMDRVLATMSDGVLGDAGLRRPDLTFVNLHQIDTAGHASGTGALYELAISQADAEIERLVEALRARGEWERTVLILVSDHGMDSTPSKLALTETFARAGISESQFLAVDNGSVDLVYLADRTASDRHALLARMRAAALAQPGVTEALYRRPNPADGGRAHTVDAVHPRWRSAGPRSGDLLVTADPGVAFSEPGTSDNPLPGNHGAPQTADNFLAIAGGGDLVRTRTVRGAGRRARPVNVDIAPTVMGLMGLFAPEDSRGRFLGAAFERRALRRAARPHRPRVSVRRGHLAMPRGGRHDVQARVAGRWRRVARNRRRARLSIAALPAAADVARVRSRSAAGIAGGWRRVALGRGG